MDQKAEWTTAQETGFALYYNRTLVYRKKEKWINHQVPGKGPYKRQIVLSSRHEMAAVISETQAAQVLVVAIQNNQQASCWNLQHP